MKTATFFGKRILVGILIFVLAFGLTINVFAGETVNTAKYNGTVTTTTYTDANAVYSYLLANHTKNLVEGLAPTIVDSNGTAQSTDYSVFYDLSADTYNGLQMPTATGAVNITYDLKYNTNITGVLLATAIPLIAISDYEIYVSDIQSALYDSSNKVLTYANYDTAVKPAKEDAEANGATRAQMFAFGGLTGRYIGIKLLGEFHDYWIARVSEIAVYGTAIPTTSFTDTTAINTYATANLPQNLLTGLVPSVVDSTGATQTADYSTFVDGSADAFSAFQMPTATGAVNITYDLQSSKDITRVLFATASNPMVAISDYEIYVSDTQGTLYNLSNRALVYTNYNTAVKPAFVDAEASGATKAQVFALGGLTGRYIGIRVVGEFHDYWIARVSEIGVYSTVSTTGVSLSQSSESFFVGNSVSLVPTISPSNATNQNVSWNSSNENVATVDSSGKVTAVAAGTSTITVSTIDGNFTATCDITVASYASFTGYNVSSDGSNIITNIQPGLTVDGFISGVTLNGGATLVFKKSDTTMANTDQVGTGVTIDVMLGEDKVGSYTMVIYGDIDGNGNIAVGDLIAIKLHLLKVQSLTNQKLLAGDASRNGTISISDLLAVKKHILNITTINQGLLGA